MSEDTDSAASSNPLAEQSGDTLVMWGALAVLASWVIFEVIAEEYFVSTMSAALAIFLVVVPRIDGDAIRALARPASLAKFGGYLLVCLGVVELVADIRNNIFDAGAGTILGALLAYAGYALAYLGARKIEV
jgi:hypothetical protein